MANQNIDFEFETVKDLYDYYFEKNKEFVSYGEHVESAEQAIAQFKAFVAYRLTNTAFLLDLIFDFYPTSLYDQKHGIRPVLFTCIKSFDGLTAGSRYLIRTSANFMNAKFSDSDLNGYATLYSNCIYTQNPEEIISELGLSDLLDGLYKNVLEEEKPDPFYTTLLRDAHKDKIIDYMTTNVKNTIFNPIAGYNARLGKMISHFPSGTIIEIKDPRTGIEIIDKWIRKDPIQYTISY